MPIISKLNDTIIILTELSFICTDLSQKSHILEARNKLDVHALKLVNLEVNSESAEANDVIAMLNDLSETAIEAKNEFLQSGDTVTKVAETMQKASIAVASMVTFCNLHSGGTKGEGK
jgi:hypothetical protein